MARGVLRGAGVAWLGLIALQVATTDKGSAAVGGAFDVAGSLVKRALDPGVPAIPDLAHRTGRDEEPGTPAAAPASTSTPKTEGARTFPDNRFPGLTD
jgi:hypothetical protein